MLSFFSDIIVIGGGASGLMASYGAASKAIEDGSGKLVTVLEKMPRPARKIMITGKGRCNFTNVKQWNDFSRHIQSGSQFVKSSFYNLDSAALVDFFESQGVKTVVERGDRAYPESYHASDIVDALVRACNMSGVKIVTGTEVKSISKKNAFFVDAEGPDGPVRWRCDKLIIATGGLSYPSTGSSGDGYAWAAQFGHTIKPTFPSLTALVPRGYKSEIIADPAMKGHIDRSCPLSETGRKLCGVHLKNVQLTLFIEGSMAGEEFGELDFTDGGIEGPIGFQLSRKCVKAIINGSRVRIVMDLKPGIERQELLDRIRDLWKGLESGGSRIREKDKCRLILEDLLPRELIQAFTACHPEIITLQRRSRTETKLWVNLEKMAAALKEWVFDIDGYVGYERCVVTAGGVATDELSPKTMESKLCPGLYLCGEVLDIDSDTGGYNLQTTFCTGFLAGQSAAR